MVRGCGCSRSKRGGKSRLRLSPASSPICMGRIVLIVITVCFILSFTRHPTARRRNYFKFSARLTIPADRGLPPRKVAALHNSLAALSNCHAIRSSAAIPATSTQQAHFKGITGKLVPKFKKNASHKHQMMRILMRENDDYIRR
jgi:hypothetical protein